jgi:short-subunit dehydrogenase
MKKIVITGAGRGVGRALSLAFAVPGMSLVLISRSLPTLEDVARLCIAQGASVTVYACDIQDRARLAAILLAEDDRSPVDCVIANAGLSGGNRIDGTAETRSTTEALADVNFTGAILTASTLLDRMKQRRSGHIVFIGSVMGLVGFPHSPTYCASKAGLGIYADAIRVWLSPFSVHVSMAYLGYVDTDMSRRLETPKPFMLTPEAAAQRIVRGIRKKRAVIPVPGLYYWATRLMTWVPSFILRPILLKTLIDVPPPFGVGSEDNVK